MCVRCNCLCAHTASLVPVRETMITGRSIHQPPCHAGAELLSVSVSYCIRYRDSLPIPSWSLLLSCKTPNVSGVSRPSGMNLRYAGCCPISRATSIATNVTVPMTPFTRLYFTYIMLTCRRGYGFSGACKTSVRVFRNGAGSVTCGVFSLGNTQHRSSRCKFRSVASGSLRRT